MHPVLLVLRVIKENHSLGSESESAPHHQWMTSIFYNVCASDSPWKKRVPKEQDYM